jgi:sialate O-acetylesterase
MRLTKLFLLAAFAGTPAAAFAEVKLHPLFTDHMVIQRGAKAKVFGTATPGEKVTVALAAAGKSTTGSAVAGPDGTWTVELAAPDAGLGYTLDVKGTNAVALKDVAVGDVWVCSGQSNMEWKVKNLTKDGQAKKVADAAKTDMVRLFTVPNRPMPTPQKAFATTKTEGLWLECTPETAMDFSAVGYVFGRDIAASQKIPVGLIASDWGGTPAEAWTSREGLSAHAATKHYVESVDKVLDASKDKKLVEAKYQADVAKWKEAADKAKADGKAAPRAPTKPGEGGVNQNSPTALYNGMIAPLLAFPIKGAIWYQGESNAGRAKEYRALMPALITDWRAKWGTELPFYMVQLAPFGNGNAGRVEYAELRDAQFATTKALNHVGIAVITDVGDETDIHPQQKVPVGMRLALAARADAYGEKVEFSGPEYKAHAIAGDKVTVAFSHVGGGLTINGDDKELAGFALCGDDKVFHPAAATIQGDAVVLHSDKVAKPVAARFGWVNFAKPTLNFFNKAGLPAVPFRTDDFPLTTK